MIVNDLDVVSVAVGETKTDSPLVIDADAVLSGTFPEELLEVVGGWDAKVEETGGGIEQNELA